MDLSVNDPRFLGWSHMFPYEAAMRLNAREHTQHDIDTMRAACVKGVLLGYPGARVWSDHMDQWFPMERQ
jgi:hypothetical protein